MRSRKTAALTILLGALAAPGEALNFRSVDRGKTAAPFLKLGSGARAVGMGEAFSAAVDDANALHWNPAALTLIPRISASFSHAEHIGETAHESIAYGHNFGPAGALGAGVQYFSAGRLTQTDDATGVDLGEFTPNDLAVSFAYAVRLKEGFGVMEGAAVGVSAKFVRSQVLDTGETAAVDLGLLSAGYLEGRLRVAFTMTNLGGSMQLGQEPAELPLALRLGSVYAINPGWVASCDAVLPNDNAPAVALGTEYSYVPRRWWTAAARVGFNSRHLAEAAGFGGLTAGLGLSFRTFSLDYGLRPLGVLGVSHRFSLTYRL